MKSLKSNIDSRRGKNVDILLISEEVIGCMTMISVTDLQSWTKVVETLSEKDSFRSTSEFRSQARSGGKGERAWDRG